MVLGSFVPGHQGPDLLEPTGLAAHHERVHAVGAVDVRQPGGIAERPHAFARAHGLVQLAPAQVPAERDALGGVRPGWLTREPGDAEHVRPCSGHAVGSS